MKKAICLAICAAMAFMLAACGNGNGAAAPAVTEAPAASAVPAETAQPEQESFAWTRAGTFEDADGNMLSVVYSDTVGYEGWAVTFVGDDDVYGWIIQQEGNTLHGNLSYDDSVTFIVTISEEGADGLLMEVDGGESYHFTPAQLPESIGSVSINTEGIGQIAFAETLEELEFDDEYPYTSAQVNLMEPTTYFIGAKERDPDWAFVKWTKDGADYTTDAVFPAELSGDADFVAVFEYAPGRTEAPKSEQTATAGSRLPLKDNPQEAEYQIKVAMQYVLEEMYGDKINDARIYVEKMYTAEEEQEEPLKYMDLGMYDVAFVVRTELHPAEGADIMELVVPNGEYNGESGWVVDKRNVGVLRPNDDQLRPYIITDFGTGF